MGKEEERRTSGGGGVSGRFYAMGRWISRLTPAESFRLVIKVNFVGLGWLFYYSNPYTVFHNLSDFPISYTPCAYVFLRAIFDVLQGHTIFNHMFTLSLSLSRFFFFPSVAASSPPHPVIVCVSECVCVCVCVVYM